MYKNFIGSTGFDILAKVFAISLVVLGIIFSAMLFQWAIEHKLAADAKLKKRAVSAEIRERELTCLARNIYYEAGNEPFEGKVAVAQVTLNRAQNDNFPADICKVVYQKNIFYAKTVCQFSWYCDHNAMLRPIDKPSYDESMIVAKKVLLEGFRLPSLHDALYYHATYIDPRWNREVITTIGRHKFYK
jgi:spore germination cell wall hydrolase CwlJ-like protein